MGGGLSLCSGGTPVTASHVIESKAVPVEAVKPTTWNTLSLNEDDTVKERQRDENLTPSQSFEIDDSVAENQSVDDAGGGGLKSLKSLRRRASVYSQGDDGSGKFVARGEVRETKMLRAGSVKNTGVFVNQYAVIKNLGSGSFGKVKLAMDTVSGELVAIKVVMRANQQRKKMMMRRAMSGLAMPEDPDEQFKREIAVMKKLSHPNVVQLIEVIDDPQEQKLMLVMEFVDGGVVDCQHPIKEDRARKLFQDAAKGLHYLHQNNIVHGDLKPDNMLLSDEEGIVKLTDFGSASMFVRGDTMNKTNGTPAFMCPEMCEAKPYRGRVADCWALGICLWNMVFGKPPFHGNTIVALYEAIRDKELEFPPETPVSDELKDLFIRTLKKDPAERLNLTEIMCHPWTTKNGTYDIIIEEGTAAFNLAELTRKAVVKEIALLLSDFPRKEYREGEYLFMAGFPAEEMFYIEEGQVDIVLRAQDREWLQQGEEGGLGKADIHSDSDESDETDSEEEEDDLPNEQEDGIVNPGEHKTKPAWAVSKFSTSTYQIVKSVSSSLHRHMSNRADQAGEEVLQIKRDGEFVGVLGLPDSREPDKKHTVTARAKGYLRVVVISQEAADEFISKHPDKSATLKKAMAKRDVETQVYNVMARLSTLHQTIKDTEQRKTGMYAVADLPPELRHLHSGHDD